MYECDMYDIWFFEIIYNVYTNIRSHCAKFTWLNMFLKNKSYFMSVFSLHCSQIK